jgi:ribonuclease E
MIEGTDTSPLAVAPVAVSPEFAEAAPVVVEARESLAEQAEVIVVAQAPAEPPAVIEAVVEAPASLIQVAPAPIVEPTLAVEIAVEAVIVQPNVAEPLDLDKTLAESGLVMVQTTSTAAIGAEPAAAPKLGRPRKEKPAVTEEAAPLQMVETGK